MSWYVWLGGLLIGAGGVGGLVSTIGKIVQDRRNEKSQAVSQAVIDLATLSKENRAQIELDMKLLAARDERIKELEADVAERDRRIAELERQLKEMQKGAGA